MVLYFQVIVMVSFWKEGILGMEIKLNVLKNKNTDYENEKNEKQEKTPKSKTGNLLKSAFKFNNYCLYL